MKTLRTFVLNNPETDLSIFKEIAANHQKADFSYDDNVETVLEAIHAHKVDLLIFDFQLGKAAIDGLEKLIERIEPDLATLTLRLEDADFVRFKLSAMSAKWLEAQSDGKTSFLDDSI